MLSARRAVPLLAVIAVATLVATGAEARAEAISLNWQSLARDFASVAVVEFQDWVVRGYARRPAVMIGLGAVLTVPMLVLAGVLLHRRRTELPKESIGVDGFGPTAVEARIALDGRRAVILPPGRDLVQIGRLADNDVCIEDESVQQYHAVIERLPPIGFAITDVSGMEADGLRINGEQCLSAVLADGDLVEIGRTRMRFEIQH